MIAPALYVDTGLGTTSIVPLTTVTKDLRKDRITRIELRAKSSRADTAR